ncbi:MAG: MerR family transcriptional regulator [Rickettsiales bacterium]|nr:MerR family transcriptional regulator [Rickettsiales bacterium]
MAKADSMGKVSNRTAAKSPSALRTISEAADLLDVPQHVLRFWETKFSQIKPLKRSGGRRYYRPEDIEVLLQIKNLLYKQGFTIKGAKKIFEEKSLDALRQEFSDIGKGQGAPVQNDNVAVKTSKPLSTDKKDRIQAVRDELKELSIQLRSRQF